MPLRFLVLDAYHSAGREALHTAGCTEAGELYARMLRRLRPDAQLDVRFPADGDPDLGEGLAGYDGICWTGSSLTIHREGDERVRRQIDLCRAAFEAGVPQFGSCFANQLAVTTAGGACGPSPRGREFGICRNIELSDAGRAHALFEGTVSGFDALTSHEDEVVRLPPGATVLASNAWCAVQAVDVRHARGTFWAVQYHPEYDLREIARLCTLRADELIDQGHFGSAAEARAWSAEMERVHDAGGSSAIRSGTDEVENWLRSQVESAAAASR